MGDAGEGDAVEPSEIGREVGRGSLFRTAAALVVAGAGSVGTITVVGALAPSADAALVFSVILLSGPAWALVFALVSEPDDFAAGARSRSWWLRVLPWTFLLAPLVLPNLVLLTMFLRDSRADGGRSLLSLDRMRPGDRAQDHHWPYT